MDLMEHIKRLAAHALRGRVRSDLLRVGIFQFFQSAESPVVLIVGYSGCVLIVILLTPEVQFVAQLIDLQLDVHIVTLSARQHML